MLVSGAMPSLLTAWRRKIRMSTSTTVWSPGLITNR